MDQHYTRTAIALHWLLAIALIAQVFFGWYLEDIPRGTPARGMWVNWHKTAGLLLWVLVLIRLVWRLGHRAPPLPAEMPVWQRQAANLSHFVLYGCMFLMPISGYVASNFSKHGLKLFNSIMLPPWGSDDKSIYAVFNQTHKVLAIVFSVTIAIHVLAALSHLFRRDDRIFARMLPRSDASRHA
jgi:cytochrome b561